MSTPNATNAEQRMISAGVRATDALIRLRLRADKISEALDEVTAPHGIPIAELSDEDSLVTTVADARSGLAAAIK